MKLNNELAILGLPLGSLDAYIHHVNQLPFLTQAEELNCAERFHNHGDLEAARMLVLAHLRYVVRVARGYAGYGLPLEDLIQEGNVGLMKAVKRFDPSVGVRLVSFAVHWIKAEIHEFVIKNWRIVKIATTKAQRKLFFNMRQLKQRLGWMNSEEIEAIANDLGVMPQDVLEMERRLNALDTSYDGDTLDEDNSAYRFSPAGYLHDPVNDPALIYQTERLEQTAREELYTALSCLDSRSQDILKSRWLGENKAPTLHELAARHGISAERVRQLEKNAMKKLRSFIEQCKS